MHFILILFSIIHLIQKANAFIESNNLNLSLSYSQLKTTSSVQLSLVIFNFRFVNNFSYSYFGVFKNYKNVGYYVIPSGEEEIYNIEEKLLLGYENEKFFVFSILDYSVYNFYQSFFVGCGIGIKFTDFEVGAYIDKVDFLVGGYRFNFFVNVKYNEIEELDLSLSKDFQSKTLFTLSSEIKLFELNSFKLNTLFSYSTCFVNNVLLPYGIGVVLCIPYMYKIKTKFNFSDILFNVEVAMEKFF